MHNNQQNRIIFIVFILFATTSAQAQSNLPTWELGLGIGSYIYQGDLTPERLGSSKTMRFGVNLYASKLMSASFALRTNLAIGGLRGDDAKYTEPEYRQQRNFNFRSRVFEVSELLVWNPLRRNYEDRGLSPYVFVGAGLNFVRIRRDWSNYNAEYFDGVSDVSARLEEDIDHRLPRVLPVIPTGIGIRYGISPRIAVSAEGSYRLVFTDYLDGFSQSVNPQKNDHYHTITLGAIYRIGKKNMLACPVVRY